MADDTRIPPISETIVTAEIVGLVGPSGYLVELIPEQQKEATIANTNCSSKGGKY